MQLVLMCLAFAATVLLVLSLYPSVSNRITGQESGTPEKAADIKAKTVMLTYPLVIFSIVFAVLIYLKAGMLVSLIAAAACSVLFFVVTSRIFRMRKRR